MFRIVKNAMAGLALAGLALSQPAFAVRSSESLPAVGAKVMPQGRVASRVGSSEDLVGLPITGLLLGLGIITLVVVVVATVKNDQKSPG